MCLPAFPIRQCLPVQCLRGGVCQPSGPPVCQCVPAAAAKAMDSSRALRIENRRLKEEVKEKEKFMKNEERQRRRADKYLNILTKMSKYNTSWNPTSSLLVHVVLL